MAMSTKFQPLETFQSQERYSLLPFRFTRIPSIDGQILLTNEVGEYLFLPEETFHQFLAGALKPSDCGYEDLVAKHFLYEENAQPALRLLAAKYRTKKAFLKAGPSLHIFVVTLRCDHSCQYCQVSRQSPDLERFDMSLETAQAAIDRLFDSPAQILTVEFQGGEPLLAFPVIRFITEEIQRRNQIEQRTVLFTMTTTLHHATDDILQFLKTHQFQVSTSLDGPSWLHNTSRPKPTQDAYEQTIAALERARAVLGTENIAALTTLTQASLNAPEEIIDTYIALGFRSIFLRPLSPYGFAVRSEKKIGYETEAFLRFYERALAYILEKNRQGIALEEAYASTLLTHILTPFSSNYVDLRSPTGSGLSVLVYNYDGAVYASDESRMLAEMGDTSFQLGRVDDSYQTLMHSEPMQVLLATGVAESLPGCTDCAFLPYCGADPVFSLATYKDPIGHRAFSAHCKRHMSQFQLLFRYLSQGDPDILRIFTAWITRKHPSRLIHTGEEPDMLPLQTRSLIEGASKQRILKVLTLEEALRLAYPLDRVMVDRMRTQVPTTLASLASIGIGGILEATAPTEMVPTPVLHSLTNPEVVKPGEVIRLQADGAIQVLYRRGANANVLFVTEWCNNYCLMCSQPPNPQADDWRIAEILDFIPLIDPTEPYLCITGGEPTLLGSQLAQIIEKVAVHLSQAQLVTLTNGRHFSDPALVQALAAAKGRMRWDSLIRRFSSPS